MAECTISCGTRPSIVDQSLGATTNRTINRSVVRPIVATYDRSYDQSWHQATDCTINRSIVRPTVRSIVRLPIHDHPQLVVSPCTTGGRAYDHVRPICDRLRFGIAGYKSFEHDHRPCYITIHFALTVTRPRPLRPVVRSFYDLPTILTSYGRR